MIEAIVLEAKANITVKGPVYFPLVEMVSSALSNTKIGKNTQIIRVPIKAKFEEKDMAVY